jgi:hypothetical protein
MSSMKKGMLKLFRRKSTDKEVPKGAVKATTVTAISEYNPNAQEKPDSLEDADWISSSNESMEDEIVRAKN